MASKDLAATAAYNREYYAENRDKRIAYQREYRAKNKDKILAKDREYYTKNKDKLSAIRRDYRAINKDKLSAYHREYRTKNKDKIRAYQREYRAKNKDKLSAKDRERYAENRDENLDETYNKLLNNPKKTESQWGRFYEHTWCRNYEYFLHARAESGSDIKFEFDGVLVAGEAKYRFEQPGDRSHMRILLEARRQVLTATDDLRDRITVLNGKQPMMIMSNTKDFPLKSDIRKFLAGAGNPKRRLIYLYSEDPSEYFEASPSNFLADKDDSIRFTPDDPKPETLIKVLSGEKLSLIFPIDAPFKTRIGYGLPCPATFQ